MQCPSDINQFPRQIDCKNFQSSAASLNASDLDKVTRFIDGEELWDLVQQHTPERAVFAKLEELQQTLAARAPTICLNVDGNVDGK